MSDSNNQKKKSGIFAAIWESMTKTGGCCGSGESCGCNSKPDDEKNKTEKKKINKPAPDSRKKIKNQ